MPDKLDRLIEAAKRVKMSEGDKEEQRRSFAYGNAKIENDDRPAGRTAQGIE